MPRQTYDAAAVTVATECHPALPTQHIIHALVLRVSPHLLVTSVDVSHPDRISTSSVPSTVASGPQSTPRTLRCSIRHLHLPRVLHPRTYQRLARR
ncbi:unnamed protein product [Mesocestoides corti]|uniref:Uncharacterized protein n=1 Tax=Mesocestoides corti TaxID=53468 RepID=A0A0R3UBY5_MESCO|nr:unnamed protein product [Mesocestoides corti]